MFSVLQYKGAHVKPGFAEHFYSNPGRYKGRENMLVGHGENTKIIQDFFHWLSFTMTFMQSPANVNTCLGSPEHLVKNRRCVCVGSVVKCFLPYSPAVLRHH